MQFRDLKTQYEALKPEIDKSISDVIKSSAFILGQPVTELENELAEYVGRKHCIGVGNGTDALVLSLRAHNIGPGDAVFVPDFTYISSASCASLVGAVPVFVDIDLKTFNISTVSLEDAIERTIKEGKLTPKAVIPVDLFGLPANYSAIKKIAEKYGLIVAEDAAQGFGGSIDGKKACSFGDISVTSFFPAKPLGCYGDGGAIFTDDDETDARLRSLRAGGKSLTDKFDNKEIGYNSRLDTLQAAILSAKFKAFCDYELDNVNKVAEMYGKRLYGSVEIPYIPEGYVSSWAQYTVRFKNEKERNSVRTELKSKGIPAMLYYPRGMHSQQVFSHLKFTDDFFSNTIEATQTVLSLPMHPYLDEETVDMICNVIKNKLVKI